MILYLQISFFNLNLNIIAIQLPIDTIFQSLMFLYVGFKPDVQCFLLPFKDNEFIFWVFFVEMLKKFTLDDSHDTIHTTEI